MTLVLRLFVIFFASLVACFAAGAIIAIAALHPALSSLAVDPAAQTAIGYVVAFGAVFLSLFALAPWALVIALAEAYAIRAALFYATAGAAIAGLTYLNASNWTTLALTVDGFARRELEITAAAGIVAGFTYWAIAGRTAGAWRPPQDLG